MTRKPWNKVYRGYVTEKFSSSPEKGVWIARFVGDLSIQHTIERIALNGTVIHSFDCFCGADRHKAWAVARDLSTSLSRRH